MFVTDKVTVTFFKDGVMMSKYSSVLRKVKEGNFFKGIKKDIFEIVCHNPGATVGEIWEIYLRLNPSTSRSRNELAKRMSDLANLGVVKPKSRVVCPVTGRSASRWFPSGNTPGVEKMDNGKTRLVSKKRSFSRKTSQEVNNSLTVDQVSVIKKVISEKKRDRSLFSFFFNRPERDKDIQKLTEILDNLGEVS